MNHLLLLARIAVESSSSLATHHDVASSSSSSSSSPSVTSTSTSTSTTMNLVFLDKMKKQEKSDAASLIKAAIAATAASSQAAMENDEDADVIFMGVTQSTTTTSATSSSTQQDDEIIVIDDTPATATTTTPKQPLVEKTIIEATLVDARTILTSNHMEGVERLNPITLGLIFPEKSFGIHFNLLHKITYPGRSKAQAYLLSAVITERSRFTTPIYMTEYRVTYCEYRRQLVHGNPVFRKLDTVIPESCRNSGNHFQVLTARLKMYLFPSLEVLKGIIAQQEKDRLRTIELRALSKKKELERLILLKAKNEE